jgi:UDP-GlcNAc:undecaprenyl-phosphate/decaprenyl-phosphate GlcNAc-1-phosphate transferase
MIYNILVYSIFSFFTLILVTKISYKFNLLDLPNKRKKHFKPTAFTGGLALSIVYVSSTLLFDITGEVLNLILPIAFLIAIVGFIDDKYNLNIGGKLSLQVLPIIYLIVSVNLRLNQLGDYEFFELRLNSFSIPFTLLSVIFLINSFNYFDGLDGTLSFTTISVLGILYFLTTDENTKIFLILILLPILIFLSFNFSVFKLPKLFLGDSGSLLLGFIIAFTLIYIANHNGIHPILLAWSITIFVYEFLSVNWIRLSSKKNIFKAGLDHLHHILYEKYKSLFLTNLLIMITNVIFFSIGYLSFNLINPITSLLLFIACFIIFFLIRVRFLNNININLI